MTNRHARIHSATGHRPQIVPRDLLLHAEEVIE